MQLPITALFAGISTLIYLRLTLTVVRLRRLYRIPIGAGNNKELQAAINSHSNFAQYVPLSIILIALCEIQNIPKILLAITAICIILGRLIHIQAITNAKLTNPIPFRVIGMRLTLFPLLGLAILLIASCIWTFAKYWI